MHATMHHPRTPSRRATKAAPQYGIPPDPTRPASSRQTPLAVYRILSWLRSVYHSSFTHGTCMRLQAVPVPLGHDMTSSRFCW